MKALIYDGPEAITFREVPEPIPSQDNVLIKIKAVGICGSDMHAYLGHDERRPAPLILGHEAAGIISGGKRDGECVTINPLVSCGYCLVCTARRENICLQQLYSHDTNSGSNSQIHHDSDDIHASLWRRGLRYPHSHGIVPVILHHHHDSIHRINPPRSHNWPSSMV